MPKEQLAISVSDAMAGYRLFRGNCEKGKFYTISGAVFDSNSGWETDQDPRLSQSSKTKGGCFWHGDEAEVDCQCGG
jgi:hypothetical protein